ncbi:MAG: GTP-binding protein [Saprospiraceae bacterium]|nr:GTP-binding protein [Saprospiraceae bacterium]
MTTILDSELQLFRTRVAEIVKDLHDLTVSIGNQSLAQTVSDLRNRIEEPFMFVIVGEVKAGKSSFINALLDVGKEITKVAPQPMTDTIQQILYGEKESIVVINEYLKKIYQPVDILKEIAIVDTPGTNTIVAHHQEITERFIPAADLIVFVFEAKNPYRQSAWDFFNYIHQDWRKKIIFVLQQKDLMPASDLQVNMDGVNGFAEKKGISQPLVFAVSAKLEQEGDKVNSGFEPLKAYIRDHITGGKAPVIKLQNNLDLSDNINEKILVGLVTRKQQWEADLAFRKDIQETIRQQSVKSNNQVDILIENLVAGYERIANTKERELSAGLNFFSLLRRSLASIFNKHASAKDWLENLSKELERDLTLELNTKLNDSILDLADSIQQMAKMIDLKLQNSQTILKHNHEIFADIAERRSNVLRDLQNTFSKFLAQDENFKDTSLFPDRRNIAPNLMTGSGLAIIGAILAAVTQGAIFDITGGVLTAVGVLFAGITTTIKRRKILNGYRTEMVKGSTRLEEEVGKKLKTYVSHIAERIDENFKTFDRHLELEHQQVEFLEKKHTSIDERLEALRTELTQKL